MPIATPQGTLDFKSVDTVTFVGASSNTVIDTTTGSLGVGVDGNGPTSNLHVVGNTRLEGDINMLHTSNTTSIKLNSNVVTEFPRSKKFIKYPRVAMTGETTSNYTVTASSWYNSPALGGSGTQYEPWKAFDNVGNQPTGQLAWYSFDYPTTEAYSGTDNAFNPNHGGTATPDLFTGAVQGEWLKIQLPHKVALDRYIMYGPNQENEFPRDWTVYGSADGTNWVRVDDRVSQIFGAGTGGGGTATGKKKEYQLDTQTNEYLYFAFVFTRGPVNKTQYLGVGEIELYGVPEYDPEADGVDVTVKSLPTVPNTDWLEVYYDAKDLADGAVTTVNDLKPSSLGSALNSSSTNNITVADDAFVFNGTDSYIKINDLTNPSGAWVHSVIAWVKFTDFDSSQDVSWIGDADGGGIRQSFTFETGGETLTMGISQSNVKFRFTSPLTAGKWHHVVYTYNGGPAGSASTAYHVFVDGAEASTYDGVGTGTLTLPADSAIWIGRNYSNTNHFGGSIANFRLFNRGLTSDEIYQLYAYQKEYFGHGDLSMTLKAGRLGIGTSEPRAALDVRGDVRFSNVPHIYATDDGGYDGANNAYINFDRVESSYGIALVGTNGTFEITEQAGAGVYYVDGSVSYHQSNGTEVRNLELKIYLNGVSHHSNNRNYGLTAMKHVTGSTYSDLGVTALVKCNVGDTIRLYGISRSSSINVHTPNNKMVIFKVQST